MAQANNTINNSIGASNTGATNTLTITNPSNTASSNALLNVTVGGTSAGDAFTTYTVAGTTNWSQGVDNSASDAFVIAASTALGTTNVLSMSTGGAASFVLGNLDVTKSASGADVSVTASNTSNTASSNATHYATVAGTSAGDAQTQYAIAGTTTWTQGIDNSDSDAFLLSASTALGTTNVLRAGTGGTVSVVLGDFTTVRSSSGGSVLVTADNTSNTASSNAVHQIRVAGASAGDAYAQFDISGVRTWSMGSDNSDSDAFCLTASTTLDGTNIIRASTAGEINYPLQPAFLAYLPSNVNNVTGNSTNFTLGTTTALTEVFDQNSDFNTNGTFTAPVTGRYQLNGITRLTGCTINTTNSCSIVTSNRQYTSASIRAASSLDNQSNISALTDMDAGDTATCVVTGVGEAADTDDLLGNATNYFSGFSGFLAC